MVLGEEGVNSEDYIYDDLFPNIVVYCIDIPAEPRILILLRFIFCTNALNF